MARARVLLAALVLAAASDATIAQQASDLAVAPRSTSRFGEIPDFSFVERSGRTLTRDDLLGEPWVAALFFTSCAGPCPRLTADIRRYLQAPLADTNVRIVSISVDPANDTPEVLLRYADTYTADPERWLFVTGDEDAIHAFAMQGLRLAVQKPEASDSSVERLSERLQISHATRLVAVDAEARIAGYYECGGEQGLAPEEVEANFALLAARVRYLDDPHPSRLPLINASLNAAAFLLLVCGWIAIKRGKRGLHAGLMRAAFVASAAFLACYVYYHVVVLPLAGGPTRYNGAGWRKPAYLTMLASHVVLAVANLPMVLRTLWLAHCEDWDRHARMARRTLPVWLYVSVTGVLVYLILYHWNPQPA